MYGSLAHLPPQFRVPIGQWDVSRVTNFESLFEEADLFNEDLSGWNVERARNMDYMFAGCTFFNQDLGTWKPRRLTSCRGMFRDCSGFEGKGLNNWGSYLGNVEDMVEMFKGCSRLDTPLDRWRLDSVTDMTRMFRECPQFNSDLRTWRIDLTVPMHQMFDGDFPDDHRPRTRMPEGAVVQVRGREGVATEIHKAVAKVNFGDLIPYLRDYLGMERPRIIDYKGLVYKTMAGFVEKIVESGQIKRQQMIDLRRIMTERLERLQFTDFSPDLLDALYYAIHFAKKQPLPFIAIYVANFITDCVYAYDAVNTANGHTMSCEQGVIERTFMTLGATCERISVLMPETDYLGDGNKVYSDLAKMITATPMFRIPDLILEWYKEHKHGAGLPKELTDSLPQDLKDEMKAQYPGLQPDKVRMFLRRRELKRYLLDHYPKEEALIDRLMSSHSNIIGYNDDNFTYG